MNDIFKTIKIHTAGTGDFTGIKNCAFSIESNDHLLFPALKRRRKPIVFIPFFCTVFTLFKNKIHPENPVHSNVLQYFFRQQKNYLQNTLHSSIADFKYFFGLQTQKNGTKSNKMRRKRDKFCRIPPFLPQFVAENIFFTTCSPFSKGYPL